MVYELIVQPGLELRMVLMARSPMAKWALVSKDVGEGNTQRGEEVLVLTRAMIRIPIT